MVPPPRLLSSICLNASKLKYHGREASAAVQRVLQLSSGGQRTIEVSSESAQALQSAVFESKPEPGCSPNPLSLRPGFDDVRKTFLLKVGYDADGKHRLDADYLDDAIASSPLIKAASDPSNAPHSRVVLLLHNPEESMFVSGADPADPAAKASFRQRLHEAYKALDKHVASGRIASYGVSSNGLSLPTSHPLHLSCRDVFVPLPSSSPSPAPLSHLLLPYNLLETLGHRANVAPYLSSLPPSFPRPTVIASRPLTAYPGGGAARDPHPLKLCDHVIPLSSKALQAAPPSSPDQLSPDYASTHRVPFVPASYRSSLTLALRHFDGEELLQNASDRALTEAEKDTLEGCRLLQSLCNELDGVVSSNLSFSAYEAALSQRIAPALHNSFEELDETTADVLASFFMWSGVAARHRSATNVRALLERMDKVPEAFAEGFAPRTDYAKGGVRKLSKDEAIHHFAIRAALDDVGGASVALPKIFFVEDALAHFKE